MELYLILALIITATVVTFAIQNSQIATVTFLFWTFNQALVLILLLFFAGGILTAFLLTLPRRIRKKRAYEDRIRALEQEISEIKSAEEKPPAAGPENDG
ncbi:MAG: LapA family protein [Pseudomonadota bacterium]